jgi:hypothetical protein
MGVMRRSRVLAAAIMLAAAAAGACGELLGINGSDGPGAVPDGGEGAPPSDAPSSPDSPGVDAAADASHKRVFYTSQSYAGSVVAPQVLEAGACQTLANNAGLGGTFVPWISLGTTSPLGSVGDGPWYQLDRTTIVATRADLADAAGGIESFVASDERGDAATSPTSVWTGTQAGGTPGLDCQGWTGAAPGVTAVVGALDDKTKSWTDDGTDNCGKPWPVYCFEK